MCRASTDPCDPAEVCSGSSDTCPTDVRTPNGTACNDNNACTITSNCTNNGVCVGVDRLCGGVCGDGIVAASEECDPGVDVVGDCCSANCKFEATGFTCRASGGVCDVAETCSGSSASCPSDTKLTSICRASIGDCDPAESCNGVSNICPSDTRIADNTTCDDGNSCTVSEKCSSGLCIGVDVYCGGICGDGIVASAEQCDDGNNNAGDCCYNCRFESSAVLCRASGGVCDPAEYCTGTTATCPSNSLSSSSVVCRPAETVCDIVEKCTGSSVSCPADQLVANNTVCDDAS